MNVGVPVLWTTWVVISEGREGGGDRFGFVSFIILKLVPLGV